MGLSKKDNQFFKFSCPSRPSRLSWPLGRGGCRCLLELHCMNKNGQVHSGGSARPVAGETTISAAKGFRCQNEKAQKLVMESRSRLALPEVRARSVRGPFGVYSGSVRSPFGVRSESVRVVYGVRSGSFGIRPGSVRSSVWGLCRIRLASVRRPFVPRSSSPGPVPVYGEWNTNKVWNSSS